MQVKMISCRTQEYYINEKCPKADIKMANKNDNDQHTTTATTTTTLISTTRLLSLRKMAKRFLRVIKKKQVLKKTLAEIQQQNAYNSSLEDMRKDEIALSAYDDNAANEALEQRLYKEIQNCTDNAAVIVQIGQQQQVLPVHPEQRFIPVHFARTESGTFFWTSMDVSRQQEMELRTQLDRWVQA